jgi:hypothetical protein
MQKKIQVLILLIFPCIQGVSQQLDFKTGNFRVSFERRIKSDYHYNNDSERERSKMLESRRYFSYSMGFKFYKSFFAELGFHQESYNLSCLFLENERGASLFSYPIESGKVFPLRIGYEQRMFNLFKHPVYVTPSIGYAFGFAQGVMLTDSSNFTAGDPTMGIFAIGTFKKGREYDINKRFGFIETRLQAEFMVSKAFSFYAGGGFNFGTHVIGRTNVTEFIGGVQTGKIVNITRGDNRYFNIGLRLRIPNFWEKGKKDKT